MNWVFWILIILLLVIVWFLISGLFKPIGKVTTKIVKDTIDIMEEEEKEEE